MELNDTEKNCNLGEENNIWSTFLHPDSRPYSQRELSPTLNCPVVSSSASLSATHLMVTHVGPCVTRRASIVTLSELSITTQSYDSMLSGRFNVTEDVVNGWTVRAKMQKCQDIRNTDTCDHFSSFQIVQSGCDSEDGDEAFSMLFHYVTPEVSCPVRAGAYYLNNFPFFSEDNHLTVHESKISTSVFGYTYKLEGTTIDRRQLFCVEAYLQLLYMRKHNWLGNKIKQSSTTTVTPSNDDTDDK